MKNVAIAISTARNAGVRHTFQLCTRPTAITGPSHTMNWGEPTLLNTMKAVTMVSEPARNRAVRSRAPACTPRRRPRAISTTTTTAATTNSGCMSRDITSEPGPLTCIELMSVFMYMRESPTPSTDSHSHGVLNVASSCMPRSPCWVMKSAIWRGEPDTNAAATANSVTRIPASNTAPRRRAAVNRAITTAAGQTLIHVARLRIAEATNGRDTP